MASDSDIGYDSDPYTGYDSDTDTGYASDPHCQMEHGSESILDLGEQGSDSDLDSGDHGYDNYVPPASTGYAVVVEPKKAGLPTYNSQSYETTSRTSHQDKQSGSYERYTAKEKVSIGEPHRERGKGQVGARDEFKRSETIKIGNKGGYTEYYTEKRVRDVSYGKSSGSGENSSNKSIK